jgi:hypothetical protein
MLIMFSIVLTTDMAVVIRADGRRVHQTVKHGFRHTMVEQDFDVVAGVPVAVVIKATGLFEDARPTGKFRGGFLCHACRLGNGRRGVNSMKSRFRVYINRQDAKTPRRRGLAH